jgi:hypothetical protein
MSVGLRDVLRITMFKFMVTPALLRHIDYVNLRVCGIRKCMLCVLLVNAYVDVAF